MKARRPWREREYELIAYVHGMDALVRLRRHLMRVTRARCDCHVNVQRTVLSANWKRNGRGLQITLRLRRAQHGNFPSDVLQDVESAPVEVRVVRLAVA